MQFIFTFISLLFIGK